MRVLARWFAYILLAVALGAHVLGRAQSTTPDQVVLPAPVSQGSVSVEAAIAARRSVREFSGTPLTWAEIGQLAWAAQGITDPARGLRAAPSAGGLYPLEVYLVTADGLYHYVPAGHKLERLAAGDPLGALRAAAGGVAVRQAPLDIVIAAVFERTRERYGGRAEGYVYLEAGHAAQNVQLQAVALGLGTVPIGGLDPARVAEALSLPKGHTPVYVMPVGHPRTELGSG